MAKCLTCGSLYLRFGMADIRASVKHNYLQHGRKAQHPWLSEGDKQIGRFDS